jgi:hypothetical protein
VTKGTRAELTEEQLMQRVRFNEELAKTYEREFQTSMAREFRDLAAEYKAELNSRRGDAQE